MTDVQVPVLVVGGGGAGLVASMLLSTYGVEHLVVSAMPTTSLLPKAHVLQQRAMEVFRDIGCADAIYQAGTPAENMSHTAWYLDDLIADADEETLHGGEPGPHDLAAFFHTGGTTSAPKLAATPMRWRWSTPGRSPLRCR